jgi:oxygen-independent coproporphyrinogen-3 oxidase
MLTPKNVELLRKYNVAGPRYTSYPTVPYWETNPTGEQWIRSVSDALDEAEAQGVGAALYVHIPFCQSLCTYCGCNTRITRKTSVGSPYVETVLKEWGLYKSGLGALKGTPNRDISISELHLGGGTPTFLAPEELKTLITGLLQGVRVLPDAEFSLEADPRVTTREHLAVLRELGFRRLSLGIQDFDHRVQDIVNRVQSEEQVRKITEMARELGYTSVNFDLIYGLPLQTRKSIEETVEAVRRLRPDRIAFYAYAHVPWIKPGQRRFTEADLPDGDEKRALYELGRAMLEEAGYREVGMDHFALETDSLWQSAKTGKLHRNFMGYTAHHVAPLIGLGVSAIGDSWSAFAQNEKLLETYQDRVAKGEIPIHRGHVLTDEDRVLRRHILNLMTRMKTDWKDASLRDPWLTDIKARLEEPARDGLLRLDGDECEVFEEGRAFLRNICMAFDARLARKAPQTQLFSKTI